MALIPKTDKSDDQKKADRQAAEEDVLLREVDDAVRQDQYADFAKNYGRTIIGVMVVGLLAFAGYLYWDHTKEAALESDSEALVAAMDNLEAGNIKTAETQLQPLVDDGKPGAQAIAMMLKAGIAAEAGRNAEAAELFARVAADDKAPQELRDLATLREIALKFDSMKPDEVIARLKPLAVPGRPYFGSAGEMMAMALLEQGKRKEAGALFAQVAKDKDVPDSLRSRTRQMAGMLGVDAIEDVNKLLDEERTQQGGQPSAQ
ncbi:MAG: tetratricopeptide repeat protein [Sphingomonadales bacterium]|nr:tetratricopeptide repeat protein [Sphingomonadales bacterium]MBD3774945.1 tetratricopeptide repeat protein [Paracoccaceae bacterium]